MAAACLRNRTGVTPKATHGICGNPGTFAPSHALNGHHTNQGTHIMHTEDYARTGTAGRTTADDTTALNTLIGTLIDSVNGYQKAAADTDNTRYAEMFNARAQERQAAVAKLQAAVARLGGNPEDDGTTAGAIHRGWLNLKEAVLGRDDEAIVNAVESGEDYLKGKFETIMDHKDLPAEARAAVEEAWTSVKAGHDQMSQLKHALDH